MPACPRASLLQPVPQTVREAVRQKSALNFLLSPQRARVPTLSSCSRKEGFLEDSSFYQPITQCVPRLPYPHPTAYPTYVPCSDCCLEPSVWHFKDRILPVPQFLCVPVSSAALSSAQATSLSLIVTWKGLGWGNTSEVVSQTHRPTPHPSVPKHTHCRLSKVSKLLLI